jgi:hypothetical protein
MNFALIGAAAVAAVAFATPALAQRVSVSTKIGSRRPLCR